MEVKCNIIYFWSLLILLYLITLLSEDVKALEKVWIVGDNFMAETFRKYFKKASAEFFLKEHYDVLPFCSSRYNDKNSNILSRLQHYLTTALNSKQHLPAYIVVFLDDDLIEHLQYKKFKVASLLGSWLEYLAKTFNDMILIKQKSLPVKARPHDEVQLYWIQPANHKNFFYKNEQARDTFSACLDSVLREYDNMRLLKIKEFWSKTDHDPVMNNRLTTDGLYTYWRAMDVSFQFNVLKRRDFLIRSGFKQLKTKVQNGKVISTNKRPGAVVTEEGSSDLPHQSKVSKFSSIHDCTMNDHGIAQPDTCSGGTPPQRSNSMATMFEDMQEFFRHHQEWCQNRREGFDSFHRRFQFN